jgi:hypothetical protein
MCHVIYIFTLIFEHKTWTFLRKCYNFKDKITNLYKLESNLINLIDVNNFIDKLVYSLLPFML